MGECFFWYRPIRVVPDKGPLNTCVCVPTMKIESKTRCSRAAANILQ